MSKTWIDEVLEMTKEAESPTQYIYWAALTAISAVMRKNVWINKKGLYKLYPNIYVFLIGRSGLRKGFPVSLAKGLVEDLDVTRVISGRISIQGMIKELGHAYTTERGAVITEANAFLATGEYSSFMIDDPAAIYCMTDLHDTHAHEKSGWVNTIATDAKRVLTAPCLTVLAASNEINLAATLPKSAHGGGLVARTFMVYADKKSKISDLFQDGEMISFSKLGKHLDAISKVSGQFKATDAAREAFNEWFFPFQNSLEESDGGGDSTGTLERIHDQVLKVAMLESLAESTELLIEARHITKALNLAQECVPAMKRVTLGGDASVEQAGQTKTVITILLKATNHEITRKRLLTKGWPHFDAYDLDRVVETLTQAGMIKIRKEKSELWYKMTDDAVKAMTGNESVIKKVVIQ